MRTVDVEQKKGIFGLGGGIIGVEADDASLPQRAFIAFLMPIEANTDLGAPEPIDEVDGGNAVEVEAETHS